jgi:hypothetical protein
VRKWGITSSLTIRYCSTIRSIGSSEAATG